MIIIAVEGTDGSGKFTQCTKLYERLTALGYKCKLQSFPCYDSLSSGPVKMYLNGDFGDKATCLDAYQASVLYATDRLCTMNLIMKEKFDVVILDRYTQSNMIHQACKIKNIQKKYDFLEWIDEFEFGTLKLPRPNVVFFLDMPVDVSKRLANARAELKAGTKKDILESDKEHLLYAYATGKEVANKFHWKQISCMDDKNQIKSIEQINEEIFKEVKKHLK